MKESDLNFKICKVAGKYYHDNAVLQAHSGDIIGTGTSVRAAHSLYSAVGDKERMSSCFTFLGQLDLQSSQETSPHYAHKFVFSLREAAEKDSHLDWLLRSGEEDKIMQAVLIHANRLAGKPIISRAY